jgi:hypothetical protein
MKALELLSRRGAAWRSRDRVNLAKAKARLAGVGWQRLQAEAEFCNPHWQKLLGAGKLTQDLIKTKEYQIWQQPVTPTEETVQQLSVCTNGGMIQPTQELMVIVPEIDLESGVS